jgi:hypothetical protein
LDRGSARRKASTYTGQHNTEKRGHTSMPLVGFEPTIPVFEWPKTVRVLDRVATGTGTFTAYRMKLISVICCTILTQGQWYTGKVTCCLFQGL